MTTEMTTPSSPKSINSDEYNMCEVCDDKVATHWRHECGCKGLCDDCVIKHDEGCEDYKIDLWLEELNKFDDLHKIKYARWSINDYEGKKWTIEKFSEKHPFQQCNKIVMMAYDRNTFSRIDKTKHTTWLDLYKLCDKRIGKYRGDHRFIEQFEVRGKTLLLWTGS